MAAAAGAGLDVPGMDPASLRLNARLCRRLAERSCGSPNEDRVGELRICSRQPGSAITQVTDSCSSATPAPSSSSAGAPDPLRHCPPQSVDDLRRVRQDKLTPSQRLRVLANPKSATAAGPRKRKVALPPMQPDDQPLPGEEGSTITSSEENS
ncbi:Hypothetical protein PHPALM_3773 [Phytophthora palmivora]|uniref:Uncharacterized protein n=1 Tax=Phytophthora palmivora TaxID=4796 RepID=A0A2P4YLK2_9STRA|nr:Hypothetical protein PHPALM_3773 [Phytophthora palmivora]